MVHLNQKKPGFVLLRISAALFIYCLHPFTVLPESSGGWHCFKHTQHTILALLLAPSFGMDTIFAILLPLKNSNNSLLRFVAKCSLSIVITIFKIASASRPIHFQRARTCFGIFFAHFSAYTFHAFCGLALSNFIVPLFYFLVCAARRYS